MKITDYRQPQNFFGGTAASATSVGGITFSATPAAASNYVLTATTSNAAQWGVPPSGFYELAALGGQATIKAHGSLGALARFDPADGNVHTGTLNANCTFTLLPPSGNGDCTLLFWITQDGTGGRTITWPGSVTWDGGTPSPSTTAGVTVRYVLETIDGGTTWIGDLVGSGGVSGGVPALTLGTSNAKGSATTGVLTDATIAVFDTTVPVTQASADVAATGSVAFAARRDHTHGMPKIGTVGEILISDTPSTPLVFADLIQNDSQNDLLYADL